MDGTTNIIELKGIGEKSATAFGRLGIRDVDSFDYDVSKVLSYL